MGMREYWFTDCQFPASYKSQVPTPFYISYDNDIHVCCISVNQSDNTQSTMLIIAPHFQRLEMAHLGQDGKATRVRVV